MHVRESLVLCIVSYRLACILCSCLLLTAGHDNLKHLVRVYPDTHRLEYRESLQKAAICLSGCTYHSKQSGRLHCFSRRRIRPPVAGQPTKNNHYHYPSRERIQGRGGRGSIHKKEEDKLLREERHLGCGQMPTTPSTSPLHMLVDNQKLTLGDLACSALLSHRELFSHAFSIFYSRFALGRRLLPTETLAGHQSRHFSLGDLIL